MSEEYNNDRGPLGLAEAEAVWYNHRQAVQEAMNNDPYTHGGVIDSMNKLGYINAQPFGVGPGKMILEKYFAYEEIKFLSCFRLQTATLPEVKRFKELISKFEKYLSEHSWETTMGNTVPGYTPSYNSWNNYYYGFGGGVQPSYPMEIPKEWMGETPSDISRREMSPKNWDDYFASLNNDGVQPLYGCPMPKKAELSGLYGGKVEDEVQKGPNEPDEQEEKKSSFNSSVNNKPINMLAELAARGISIPPEPEFKNRTSKSSRVVLSAEGVSSKDDVQKGLNETEDETEKKQKEFTEMLYRSASGVPGPIEPGQSKGISSLKAILDYPSTEDNKSADEENKD